MLKQENVRIFMGVCSCCGCEIEMIWGGAEGVYLNSSCWFDGTGLERKNQANRCGRRGSRTSTEKLVRTRKSSRSDRSECHRPGGGPAGRRGQRTATLVGDKLGKEECFC